MGCGRGELQVGPHKQIALRVNDAAAQYREIALTESARREKQQNQESSAHHLPTPKAHEISRLACTVTKAPAAQSFGDAVIYLREIRSEDGSCRNNAKTLAPENTQRTFS